MSDFRCLPGRPMVRLTVDGQTVEAPLGASVAVALLLAGHAAFGRHPSTGEAEGPWCLIGVCFGCLVDVDGIGDRQACLLPAKDGMIVRTRLEQR